MKSILTTLFLSFVIISINAQENSDVAVQLGTNVYNAKNSLRIKNATFVTSDNIPRSDIKKGIIILPNAATQDVKIIFKTDKAASAKIIVLDENGKKVLHQDTQIAEGNNNINIDNFHTLNDGTYTIQLISNSKTYTSAFMIWK